MGTVRRTETYNGLTQAQQQQQQQKRNGESSVNMQNFARYLQENQLGGVIFGCKHYTMGECLSKQLFGLPSFHYVYIKNIKPGLPLFLFNYNDRRMHGIFEAASAGQMNIDPYAWTDGGSVRTPYPAQVRVCIRTQCLPILETKYKKVIGDNYYHLQHFYFELDHEQTRRLLGLFKPASVPANIKQAQVASRKMNFWEPFPSTKRNVAAFLDPVKTGANDLKAFNNFDILDDTDVLVPDNWGDSDLENVSSDKSSVSVPDKKVTRDRIPDFWDSDDAGLPSDSGVRSRDCRVVNSLEEIPNVMSDGHTEKTDMSNGNSRCVVSEPPNFQKILQKLKEVSVLREQLIVSPQDSVSDQCMQKEVQLDAGSHKESLTLAAVEDNDISVQGHENAGLLQVIIELKQKASALEKKQNESDQELQFLREVVKHSERKIEQLEGYIEESQLKNNSCLSLVGETSTNLDQPLIYLIGGYNSVSWLASLDSFSLSRDRLISLRPMSSARSYASAAALKDSIFVFGGGDGRSWYNTVERYDPKRNEWRMCPHLNREKGSLAGVAVGSKLFAIGGGDGHETFSEVEMFDPVLGKWIYGQSMLQRRFAPAAAELNGVLYTVGGYDGSSYLESAERYDPREGFWVQLPSMSTRRGCHCLTVLGESLYALGGYDGENMVSSVEIFDPRLGSWMMGEPMSSPRGYASAVTLDDSLLVIGGLKSAEQLMDSVEVYKTGNGWSDLGFKSIGQRCFFSAIVLQP